MEFMRPKLHYIRYSSNPSNFLIPDLQKLFQKIKVSDSLQVFFSILN